MRHGGVAPMGHPGWTPDAVRRLAGRLREGPLMPSQSPQPRDRAAPESWETIVGAPPTWPDVLAGEEFKPPPKQERGHRARESILRAAQALFARNGFEATTVEEIAKGADTAVGGFYRHFRSKRQVLLVLMRRLLDEFAAARSTRRFNETAEEALERLRLGLKVRWIHAGTYRAWREAAVRDPGLAALQVAIEGVVTANIASSLAIAATAPGRRPELDLSALATIINVMFWRLLDGPPGERDAVSETMMMLVRHALYEDAAPEPHAEPPV
jgi:AcrR family transcriptional regulator